MPRKTITQIAAEDRARTAKWRARRAVDGIPESRQIDKAVLDALLHMAQQGTEMMIDEARFKEAMLLACRLLARRHNPKVVAKAVEERVLALHNSTTIRDLKLNERYARRYSAPETVTA